MEIKTAFDVEFNYPSEEIYLDSATVGKLPIQTISKVKEFYCNVSGSSRGTHKYSINTSRILEQSRSSIASIFNIEPSRLSFLPSREVALYNSLFSFKGDHQKQVITSILEDHSILGPIIRGKELSKHNIKFLSLDDEIDITEQIKKQIENQPSFVILSALSLGLGVIRDWEKIAEICKNNESILILDISYAIGHQKFDFSKTTPDIVISSSSSGALGPFGTALQIIDKETTTNSNPFLVGGGSIISLEKDSYKLARNLGRYEPGILNTAAISGLATSLEILQNIGLNKIENHEFMLRKELETGLKQIDSIEMLSKEGIKQGPIISFKSSKIDPHDIAIVLEDIANILVRSGALCTHLFMNEVQEDSLVQLSTHCYNSKEEIHIVLETLSSIMDEM